MRARIGLLLVMIVLEVSGQARADSPDFQLPMIKRCLGETASDELRRCTQSMAKLVEAGDEVRRALRSLAALCAEKETVQEVKECLAPIIRPETQQERKQTEELKAAVRAWGVSKDVSRMDSSSRVFLTLGSEDEVVLGYGKRARPVLFLRCIENTTALIVSSDWYLAENVSAQWRLDQDKPVAQTWNSSTNHKSAGLWDGGRAIPFIKNMLGKKTLLVRLTTYSEGAKEMAFNVEGLDKVIEPLRTACKW